MTTIVITKSKIAHWEEYSTCLENQKIFSIVFDSLDEPNLKQIISTLDKQTKILSLVTKISFVHCSFGKSSSKKFKKLIQPSLKSLIFQQTSFNSDGAIIFGKIQKISSLEEISFFEVDLRGVNKALCSLLLKGRVNINMLLTQTSLGPEYCAQLFDTMKICSNLKSLELNNIEEHSLDKMLAPIASNTSLTKFIISADVTFTYSMKDLNKMNLKTNLIELQLRECYWQHIDESTFFEDNYKILTKLVADNIYHPHGFEQIARSIKPLTNLKSLSITGPALPEHLLDAIISKTSITELILIGRDFQNLMAKCQSVKSSVNLRSLSLDYECFSYKYSTKESYLEAILSTGHLTKLKLSVMSEYEISGLIDGLNSVNCRLTELQIIELLDQAKPKFNDLLIELGKNTTITKLSLKNTNLPRATIEPICELLRVNKTIQSLVLIETTATPMSLNNFTNVLEVLKVNKTLLYLEMTIAEREKAVDLIANEFSKSNSTLLFWEPFSEDYHVDMWLHQNRKLRVNMSVILHNIMRTGSILPLEIWLKIFEYLGYCK